MAIALCSGAAAETARGPAPVGPVPAELAPTGAAPTGLSLEECLAAALSSHPSLWKARGGTRGEAAQLEQYRANNRVTVGLTGSLNYDGDYQEWSDRAYSDRAVATASKLLYDTGRNRLQKEMQTETLQGARENERTIRVNVAAGAKKAYYDLVLKLQNREVEREKLRNLEEHLKTARGLYEVGNSPYVDVTKAEADAASARVSLLKAESDILVSQEALRVAMGVETEDDILPTTALQLPSPAPEMRGLLEEALRGRPDYLQAQHTIRARELSVKNAARASSPTVTGQLSSTFSDYEGTSASTNYGASISLNIPLLDGGSAAASVEAARAQVDQAQADRDALRHTIVQGVRSAALTLANAIERVHSAETSVRYSEENLEMARGRYEVGVGDPLELSDAVLELASSRYSYYQALYDAQAARADLDQAMGRLPAEAGE